MEGEFCEVKRKTNPKANDDKMKNQPSNVRGAADGQDDSSTKENVNCKNSKPAVNANKAVVANANQTTACKAQTKPKVFGKDFLEAPLPKVNPWTKAKQNMSSDMENGTTSHAIEVTCTKNTNAAETSTVDGSPKLRCEDPESHTIPCDDEHDGARKTDASPTKGKTYQRISMQSDRTMPAHSSHQGHNPAYKTSNKVKLWDKKNKDAKTQNTDFNDSAQWPSLDIVVDKNKQDQTVARPKCPQPKLEESNESDVESQVKPGSPPSEENVNNQPTTKKKSKQKWVQLPIELKTERRRGGNRGRGLSRPQYYDDQNRRSNRTNFRRPNRTRDGSRQGDADSRVTDENERNNIQAFSSRGINFRGRRGQGRGRGGYTRAHRDSTSHDHEEISQPFFAPSFISESEVMPVHVITEAQQIPKERILPSPNSDCFHDGKIILQIEYYFSEKNLAKDEYLRHKMDEEGWVELSMICAFPRVKQLSDSIDEVIRAMQKSSLVELSSDFQKLRTRKEPQKWPLKPEEQNFEWKAVGHVGNSKQNVDPPRKEPPKGPLKPEEQNLNWKVLALASNSKLKVDAPVFVPGQQYIPMTCMGSAKLPVMKDEQSPQQNSIEDDSSVNKDLQ